MNRRALMIGLSGAAVAAGGGVAAWRSAAGSMAEYDAYSARLRASLSPPDVVNVIRFATLAANGHNTQPWRFRISSDAIDILPDYGRRTPVVDPDTHHLFVSLGCAAANLAIAAAASGRPGDIEIATDGAGVRYQFTEAAPQPTSLLGAITKRQSTRADYDGRAVDAGDLAALQSAAELPGVNLVLVTARPQMMRIRDLILAGNEAQMGDAPFVLELRDWLRFNPRRAMASGDGLFSATTGNPSLPTPRGRLAFNRLFTAASENDRYARQIDSSAGIAIFIGDEADRTHWI